MATTKSDTPNVSKNKTGRQKQLERRPMKRTLKGKSSGLIKTAQLTRRAKRTGQKTSPTTKPVKLEAQAQTIEPENQLNLPKQAETNKSAVNGHGHNKQSLRSREKTKLEITKLLVSGIHDYTQIALYIGFGEAYTRQLVKKVQADVLSMSIDEYRSLLNSKLVQLLHNHTTISSTLALELHKLDTHIHDCDELIKLDSASHDARSTPMQTKRASLAQIRLTMLREQRDNNASLFQTLGRVGVSQVQLDKKKEPSIPLSPNNNISTQGGVKGGSAKHSAKHSNLEVSKNSLETSSSVESGATLLDISGYAGVSKAEALAELKRSTKQMDRYLRETARQEYKDSHPDDAIFNQEKGGQVEKA